MELRDLKAPLCMLAAQFGGIALSLWGLFWGLVLVLAHRPVGSFLGVVGFLVFLSACVVSIAAGLSVTVWSVLATYGVDEEARGLRPRFLRIWRRAGPHVLGLAICTVVAVLMSAAMTVWPLRLIHVDLLCSWTFVLQSVRAMEAAELGSGSVRDAVADHSTVMLVNLALTFSAFELAMFLRRTSLFRQKPFLGTKAAALVGVCFVFLPFACYPKVKGFVKARRFRRNSSVAVVTYVAFPSMWPSPEDGPSYQGFFISTPHGSEPEPFHGIFYYEKDRMRSFIITEDMMSALVRTLAAGGFFEMEATLHPYGTMGGTWEILRISDGTCKHAVASYYGEPRGLRFEALREHVIDWFGGGKRWWEDEP